MKKRENGGFMVLFCISMIVIFGLAAIVIDVSRMMNDAEKARQNTKLATLRALEEYVSARALNETKEAAKEAAVEAVNKLLNDNEPKSEDATSTQRAVGLGEESLFRLELGCWKRDESLGKQVFTPDETGDCTTPNAVRISGNYVRDTEMSFGRFFGIKEIAPYVKATAMVVPRHIYFLVDTSFSTTQDTFNFKLNCPDYVVSDICYKYHLPLFGVEQEHYKQKFVLGDGDYNNFTCDVLRDLHPCPSTAKTCNDNFFGPSEKYNFGSRESFHVYAYRGVGTKGRPQPLADIYDGIHNALKAFKARSVAGDKAGVIMFSNGLFWPRMTVLTDKLDQLINFTNYSDGDTDEEGCIFDSDDINTRDPFSNASTGVKRAVRYGLIPMFDSIDINKRSQANRGQTHIKQALEEAVQRLLADGEGASENVSNAVVLFTDGLQTCWDDDPTGVHCNASDYNYYVNGMNELQRVVNTMVANNIPLHIFPAGKDVGPHWVALENLDTGTCFTDAEFRSSKNKTGIYDFVRGSSGCSDFGSDCEDVFNNKTASKPFYQSMRHLYKFAVDTGGVWAPLLTQVGKICDEEEWRKNQCDQAKNYGQLVTTDCRTQAQQIKDAMDDYVVGVNPYQIVEIE